MPTSYLLQAIYEMPWAILPAKLAEIVAVAQRHAAGERLPAEMVAEIAAASRGRQAMRQNGAVAVLPIFGTIIPHGDQLAESSGAVSAQHIAANFRAAVNDPNVAAVVLDISSPGGAVQGVEEVAAEIHAARGFKPIVAVADHLAASAAYWIAVSADELLVTPSGEVGSIGVFAVHEDWSRAMDQAGVSVSIVSAGKYKVEGNPYQPLAEEARAAMQARVDEYYNAFVKAVARGRGASVEDVRKGFGEGRVVGAREAVSLGMADSIGTLDTAIARAAKLARGAGQSISAQADGLQLRERRARLAAHYLK